MNNQRIRMMLLASTLCVVVGLFAGVALADRPKDFPIFNAISLKNRPKTVDAILQPIVVHYGQFFYERHKAHQGPPPVERVRKAAASFADHQLVCLDVEHLPMAVGQTSRNWEGKATQEMVDATMKILIDIIATMREVNPTLRIGYYGIMPARNYWETVGRTVRPEKYEAWRAHNRSLHELSLHVDVIFPSLYTFYEDQDGWEVYARFNIREARQYGKPVYPFLMPAYHTSNKVVGRQPIPGGYWKRQLWACYRQADGVVIWTGPSKQWDESAGWWNETVAFLQEIKNAQHNR